MKEELLWILDKEFEDNEEQYERNINFVHSLGLRCDRVGV